MNGVQSSLQSLVYLAFFVLQAIFTLGSLAYEIS